jgi:hypothetical protein
MADLVSGRYPQLNPFQALLGQTGTVVQGNSPARSNLEYFGLGNPTDGALAGTGVACAVPIPIDVGQIVTKISIFAGATAEATGTHLFAALYSGIAVPALLGQSTDNTGAAAVAASARFDFTLASAVVITPAMAPNGFVYASIVVVAGTVPTALTVSVPTAVGYQWYTTAPLFLSATHGSALTTTAPATIATPAAKAVAPIVVLS